MNIHQDKTEMLPDTAGPADYGIAAAPAGNAPFAVRTIQTPDQQRLVSASNYPRHGWGDVRNLAPMRRGHGY
jgi:hypothetical protein